MRAASAHRAVPHHIIVEWITVPPRNTNGVIVEHEFVASICCSREPVAAISVQPRTRSRNFGPAAGRKLRQQAFKKAVGAHFEPVAAISVQAPLENKALPVDRNLHSEVVNEVMQIRYIVTHILGAGVPSDFVFGHVL